MKTVRGEGFNVVKSIVIALLLLVASGEAFAATYYVSPTGSDSSSGSLSAPFKTIQNAAFIVNPGDTVLVRAGTYAGFKVSRSGSSGKYIVFKPYPGETVILNSYINRYVYTAAAGVELYGASYIEINGFKITDSNPLYDSTVFTDYKQGANHSGVQIHPNGSGVASTYARILNNEIYRIGFSGILASKGSNNCEYANNTIYNTGLSKRGYGVYIGGDDVVIRNNIVHDAYGYGIQAQNGDSSAFYNMLIDSNVSYNNGHADYCNGWGTLCPTSVCSTGCPGGYLAGDGIYIGNGHNATVLSNVVDGNMEHGIRVLGGLQSLFANNTVYNNALQGIYLMEWDSHTLRNTISYHNGSTDYIGAGNFADHNLQGIDPKFVNPSIGDFHLQSTSPAINKGVSIAGYTYDADGNAIVGVPDIGAYEYIDMNTAPSQTPADTQPPTVPAGLAATAASASQINLAWTASTDNIGVTGYKIYRNGTQIATATTTSYSNTGLSASTSYTYTVSAYDGAGNLSAQSASVSAKTLAPPDTQAPTVPTGLTATAASASQINLAWTTSTDNVGVTGYRVYRNGIQVGTATTASYSDSGLAASTTYSYTVSAYDAAGNVSAQSASVSATALTTDTLTSPDTQAPTVPAGLAATAVSVSQINLKWTASTDNVGVAGYKIYRNGTQIATATTTSYSDTGLAKSTSYKYAVSAFDAAGNESGKSASVSAKTRRR